MPLYEYDCITGICPEHAQIIERIVSVKTRDEQTCNHCKKELKRIISTGGGQHSSWSSWKGAL